MWALLLPGAFVDLVDCFKSGGLGLLSVVLNVGFNSIRSRALVIDLNLEKLEIAADSAELGTVVCDI